MAFTLENLSIATNNMKAGVVPSLWIYYNEDVDNVLTTSFFVEPRLTVGDQMAVIVDDNKVPVMHRVSAVTSAGLATVIRIASEFVNAQPVELVTFVAQLAVKLNPDVEASLVVTSAADTDSTFTASATTGNFITLTKDVIDDTHFVLTTVTTLPAGLSLATAYYAVNSSVNKCQLSLTPGGAAVAITGAGTGAHTATSQSNQVMLDDGFEGQRKVIKIKTDGGADLVVVPENLLDGGIATGADALDVIELIFEDGTWNYISNTGFTIGAFA